MSRIVSLLAISGGYSFSLPLGMAFVGIFLLEINFSIPQIALISAFSAGLGTLANYPVGTLADRWGRKRWIILGLILLGAGLLLLSRANDFTWALISLGIISIGFPLLELPFDAHFADVIPEERRGRFIGINATVYLTMGAIAPAAAGFLFMVAINLPFTVAGLTALCLGMAAVFLLKEKHQAPKKEIEAGSKGSKESLRSQVHPFFYYLVVGGALMVLASGSMGFVKIFLFAERGFPPGAIGVFLGIVSGLLALASPFCGEFVDKVKRPDLLIVLGCISRGLFFVLLPFVNCYLWLFAIPVVGLGYRFPLTWMTKASFDIAPPKVRGRLFAIDYIATDVASMVAPLIYGMLWEIVGPTSIFYVASAFVVLGGAVLVIGRRACPKKQTG